MKRILIWFLCFGQWHFAPGQTASDGVKPAPGRAGLKRARVLIVHDPDATETFNPRPDKVRSMLDCGLTNLTRKTSVAAAWATFVSPQDVVGLKVVSAPGRDSGTRPAVVEAVIKGLLEAHLPPNHIIIWDKRLIDLRRAGFQDLAERYGVRVASSAAAGYDERFFYDAVLLGQLVFGDLEFGKKGEGVGRKSYLSKLVSKDITKIINITPLLNHNDAGVSGNLWSLGTGSVDNTLRFEADRERLATAIPDLYALPLLGDRVVLNIVDALICQYEGGQNGLLQYSTVLNEIRLSTDPVALDVLSLQELDRQRRGANSSLSITNYLELYQNASLVEIGVSDSRNIQVEKIQCASQ
jgi:hypothetical protein